MESKMNKLWWLGDDCTMYTTLVFLFVSPRTTHEKNRNERASLFESNDFIIIDSSFVFGLFSHSH